MRSIMWCKYFTFSNIICKIDSLNFPSHTCVHVIIINRMAFLADVTVIPGRDPSVSSSFDYLPIYLPRISIPIDTYRHLR